VKVPNVLENTCMQKPSPSEKPLYFSNMKYLK
jgi:hypothetical protein